MASLYGKVPVICQYELPKACVILVGPVLLDLVLNALQPWSLPPLHSRTLPLPTSCLSHLLKVLGSFGFLHRRPLLSVLTHGHQESPSSHTSYQVRRLPRPLGLIHLHLYHSTLLFTSVCFIFQFTFVCLGTACFIF